MAIQENRRSSQRGKEGGRSEGVREDNRGKREGEGVKKVEREGEGGRKGRRGWVRRRGQNKSNK